MDFILLILAYVVLFFLTIGLMKLIFDDCELK
jgi:hypothetical protein